MNPPNRALLALSVLLVSGCLHRMDPVITELPPPAALSGANAVSITSRIEYFTAAGLEVSTVTRTSLDGFQRTESVSGDRRLVEIIRPKLGKRWRLDPERQEYEEFALPKEALDGLKKASPFKPTKLSDVQTSTCEIRSELGGPGPEVDLGGGKAHLFTVRTESDCTEQERGTTKRRHIYLDRLWMEGTSPILKSSGSVLDSDVLLPESLGAGMFMAIFGSPNLMKETIDLLEAHEKAVISLSGSPIVKVQVSGMVTNGQEISFTDQEKAYSQKMRDKGRTGMAIPTDITMAIAGAVAEGVTDLVDSSRPVEHHPIPDWVLEADPDFPKRGGVARRVTVLGTENRDAGGLFDIPAGYKRVKALQ